MQRIPFSTDSTSSENSFKRTTISGETEGEVETYGGD